ncbi:hypothetical protein ACLOJK_019631 [Asimina triloba]
MYSATEIQKKCKKCGGREADVIVGPTHMDMSPRAVIGCSNFWVKPPFYVPNDDYTHSLSPLRSICKIDPANDKKRPIMGDDNPIRFKSWRSHGPITAQFRQESRPPAIVAVA